MVLVALVPVKLCSEFVQTTNQSFHVALQCRASVGSDGSDGVLRGSDVLFNTKLK